MAARLPPFLWRWSAPAAAAAWLCAAPAAAQEGRNDCLSPAYVAARDRLLRAAEEEGPEHLDALRALATIGEAERADRDGTLAHLELRLSRGDRARVLAAGIPVPACGGEPPLGTVLARFIRALDAKAAGKSVEAELSIIHAALAESRDPSAPVATAGLLMIATEVALDRLRGAEAESAARLALERLDAAGIERGRMYTRARFNQASALAILSPVGLEANIWRQMLDVEIADPADRASVAARFAVAATRGGQCEAALPTLERAVRDLVSANRGVDYTLVLQIEFGQALHHCGAHQAARTMLTRAYADADAALSVWDYRRGRIRITLANLEMEAGRYDLAKRHVAGVEGIIRSGAGATSPATLAVLSTEVAILRARLARRTRAFGEASRLSRGLAAEAPKTTVRGRELAAWALLNWSMSLSDAQAQSAALDALRLSIALRARAPASPPAAVDREDYGISGHFLELSWLLFSARRRHGD